MDTQSDNKDMIASILAIELLDIQALSMLKDIMQEEFNQVLTLYLQDTPTLLTIFISSFKESDLILLIRTNHTLKSSSQYIGARRVSEITVRIENMLYAKNYTGIAPMLPLLEEAVRETLSEIVKRFPES